MTQFEGIIVFNPVHERSVAASEAKPDSPEWFELSVGELTRILPNCRGAPVRTEHGSADVGVVTDAFFNQQGHAAVRFRLHDTPAGTQARALIESNVMRGLSLCHNPDTLDVREVSICMKGARPNTGITGVVTETKPDLYKETPSPQWTTRFVAASFQSIQTATMMAAPMQSTATPAANPNVMSAAQASQVSQSIGQATAGTSMQYQALPPTNAFQPPTDQAADETGQKRRRVEETPAAGSADDATNEDIISRVMKHSGTLSHAMKSELLKAFTDNARAALEAKEAADKDRKQADTFKQSADTARQHFMDALIPFLRRFNTENTLSENDERELRQMSKHEAVMPFVSRLAPLMVQASSAAQFQQPAAPAPLPGDLQDRLNAYQTLRNAVHGPASTSSSSSSSYAMPPREVAASYGWQPQQPQQQPAKAAPRVDPYGGNVRLVDFGIKQTMTQ